VVTTRGFSFESGNFGKLLAAPKYALSWLFSHVVPRSRQRWVFGSGIGVAEGSLALARELRSEATGERITWLVSDGERGEKERRDAESEGFEALTRRSWRGYWATLRARHIVITHGLGDANRFGVFGARIVHLGHGVPLKKLHLDSPVTTALRGPALARAILRRMYEAGSRQIMMFVASSVDAAERLRTAHRVAPGRVRALGDPRDDELARDALDPDRAEVRRREIIALLRAAHPERRIDDRLVLYAPTWRDGAPDPHAPEADELRLLAQSLSDAGATLVIRAHPLSTETYRSALGDGIVTLSSDVLRDITPALSAFDAVMTDYSSLAMDFALLGRPIVWFAPDLEAYVQTRGLYEPLEVTARGQVMRSWSAAVDRLSQILDIGSPVRASACADSRALAERFHIERSGRAAARVLAEIRRLDSPDRERIDANAIFFESFYGRGVSCNPLAIDREIAARYPSLRRYWSVVSERLSVPEGGVALLVGGPDWFAARRHARLLVVNDWLRFGFRRRPGQHVLQTWHGTMLKHLALGRPGVGIRTRLAIRRESRRWSLLLSQNPHSTAQFRSSYAYRGEILEVGYPRDDRLARAVAVAPDGCGLERVAQVTATARRVLGIDPEKHVLSYVPTWREASGSTGRARAHDDSLDVWRLARELGSGWEILVRGHTRTLELGRSFSAPLGDSSGEDGGGAGADGASARVLDVSHHADVNDVILAADLVVTDYSSIMFDAAVAAVPLVFFVPDLAEYRDRERGFTFDFEHDAPGPLVTRWEEVADLARSGVPLSDRYLAWRDRFAPHDDGEASHRVVDELERRRLLDA